MLPPVILALFVLELFGEAAAIAGFPYPGKQLSQEFNDKFNPIKNFGGNGPYSDGTGYGISREPPAACSVDQVIYLGRHGERFPDPGTYKSIVKALDKLWKYQENNTFVGDLTFFNSWDFWIHNEAELAQESHAGAYAGLLDGFQRGSTYRWRYGHLWDGKSQVPIFASGYERIIETARKFGEGFFGSNYSQVANLNIIPEDKSQGANSLTPSCAGIETSSTCDKLTGVLPEFSVAAERLNNQNKGLSLTASDVSSLMTLVGYELNSNNYSPWVEVFTREEWISFAYTQDLNYYYCAGPGNEASVTAGALYANATVKLLNEGPEKSGSMFYSFCHDTNITPVLAAIGIFDPAEELPVDRVPFVHTYHSNDFVPMGGHLVFERLNCNKTAANPAGNYVRIVVNEAVIPLDNCSTGPGFSCSLNNYTSYLDEILADYVTDCDVPSSYPQELTFFWDWNITKEYDYQQGNISYQQGYTNS